MTPHLSILDGHPMCQDCGQNNNKHPRPLFPKKTDDDYSASSLTPKISNKSKNATLPSSQIDKSNPPQSVDSKEKRTIERNVPNDADFNRVSGSESDLENNFRSEKLDGGKKSEFRGLISPVSPCAKLETKTSNPN